MGVTTILQQPIEKVHNFLIKGNHIFSGYKPHKSCLSYIQVAFILNNLYLHLKRIFQVKGLQTFFIFTDWFLRNKLQYDEIQLN